MFGRTVNAMVASVWTECYRRDCCLGLDFHTLGRSGKDEPQIWGSRVSKREGGLPIAFSVLDFRSICLVELLAEDWMEWTS